MFSKFFIERPILANVIAIITMLVGVVAMFALPIAQYPEITPPTVQVTTRFPGATAQIIADTVALPIEQQVNGVENMLYMQSTSASDGSYKLVVTFKVGTDLNFAQVLVQNRVAIAVPALPPEVQVQGVTTKKVSTAILQVINLTSPDKRYDSLYLSNYAYINLRDTISRLPGVGDVNIFGIGEYGMRIWMIPESLKAFNLTPNDVINAVKAQNVQVPAGQLGAPPTPESQNFQYTISVRGRLEELAEFENIIVKIETGQGGRIIRVKDIARVELGSQNYSQFCRLDGKDAAGIAIYQLPGANALDVAKAVRETVERISKDFPPGLEYSIPFDTTLFTQASIDEVYKTLYEAAILVLIVILVFLQSFRTARALGDVRLIAEPWDAAGTYQLGRAFPGWLWMQWNGKYRDTLQRLIAGEGSTIADLMTRLYGSADLFPDDKLHSCRPWQSVNYITSHDGATLYDLVSYEQKNNWANGHNNTDGSSEFRWNCGLEGDQDVPAEIADLRRRQIKNFFCLLLLSNGSPMFRMGDEFGQTQGGNNNPYNQDNETSWLDWSKLEQNRDLFRFVKLMIAFRKAHPSICRANFWREDIKWYGTGRDVDLRDASHELAYCLHGASQKDQDIYVMINARRESLCFDIQEGQPGKWRVAIDTALPSPDDINVCESARPLSALRYALRNNSVVVLESI